MPILMSYDFPGNIRELENVIEYAMVVCKNIIREQSIFPTICGLIKRSTKTVSQDRMAKSGPPGRKRKSNCSMRPSEESLEPLGHCQSNGDPPDYPLAKDETSRPPTPHE